jgi:serine protease Do
MKFAVWPWFGKGAGCLALCAGLLAPAPVLSLDRASMIGLGGSVLKIEVVRVTGGYALGSGVVVARDHVVTNCHVTRDAREVNVLRGGLRWRAQAQASDIAHDLCVLQVPGLDADAVRLGRAGDLKLGQPVTAIGYTGGMALQNSAGDVVALHRHDGSQVIRSTNWFTSGASGGGLFDDQARLVGILTFRLRGGEAHYFAAPVEWLGTLLYDPAGFRAVSPLERTALPFWQMPIEAQPIYLRAALLERDQRWDELAGLAADWARTDGSDPEPWYLHGVALSHLGRLDEAQRALERSLDAEPESAAAWLRLGLVLVRRGQKATAADALGQLRRLDPERADELARALGRT